ncbi:MAG: aromatic ring-hydroxylating dioxygenase subunit alpha [Anaerolineae bacterium]|jgi:phenylpropionate dioxygenase-like ring-hydroxylating dioxygenase large terminal subunit
MIPNQWYVLLESKQVRDRPVGATRMGEKLVFWRDDTGQVSCLRDRCPHRGVALSKGQVHDGHLQCPFHGFEYDTSGRCVLIPAHGRQAPVPKVFRAHSYPTYEAHGLIWVWWGLDPPDDLEAPQFFEELDDEFTYATVYDPWDAHYSRVIENQLDVVHVPFVHANTIGRGIGTVVDGPGVEWINSGRFHVYVYNREDDGTSVRKPSQVPVPHPDKDSRLEFIFPNLWQNRISEEMRVVGAFVPVDKERTLLYLRYYQKFIQLPVLREVVAWLSMPLNRLIAHQDRRVVVTHQPQPSGLRIGEKLIQGDRPIVEYRRRRQELIQAARQNLGG